MTSDRTGTLEHVNLTVPDPRGTAERLCRLFGWHIRWEGAAMNGGYTVHVGNAASYLAVYAPASPLSGKPPNGRLNHIGVVVDDLDAAEAAVKAEGFTPYNHGSYEPGRRFYFDDTDGVEFEVVSYAT